MRSNQQHRHRALLFWAYWTLATAVGGVLGIIAGGPFMLIFVWVGTAATHAALSLIVGPTMAWSISSSYIGGLVTIGFGLSLSGMGIGAAQSLVLRRYIDIRHWVAATAVGWWIGSVLSSVFVVILTVILDWVAYYDQYWNIIGLIIGAGIGAGAGTAQAIILRRSMSHPLWWMIFSLLGWCLSWITAMALLASEGAILTGIPVVLAGIFCSELLAGAVTGVVLLRMLR